MSLFKSSANSFLSAHINPASSLVGKFESAFDFNGIICHVVSEKAHKIEIQFSDDGVNPIKTVNISDDLHSYVIATYFRVKISNDSTVSTTCDVHTYLTQNGINTGSATVEQQIQQSTTLQSLDTKQDQNYLKLQAIDTKLGNVLNVHVDNLGTGPALEATQLLVKEELANLNGKLPTSLGVKPTTGSMSVVIAPDSNPILVAIDEMALPTGASTEATLMQMKALSEVGNATLTTGLGSINTRLTGWDTAIGSIASSSQSTAGRLPTSIGQKTTSQSLSVCLSSDSVGQRSTAQSVSVCLPSDLTPLLIKSEQYGSFGNLANNITLGPLATSSGLNIQNYSYLHGFYEDGSGSGVYSYPTLEYSIDNITYFPSGSTLYLNPPSGTDTKRRAVIYKTEVAGINFVRVKNPSSTDVFTNVSVSIFGASMS